MDKVCRCCLAADATDVTHNADYQEFYQLLTNVPFQDDSGKPTSLCYECLYQFRKCMQLRDKCLKADRILTELIVNGVEISPKSILSINRSEHHLTSKCVIAHVYSYELGTKQLITKDIKIENDNYEVLESSTDGGTLDSIKREYEGGDNSIRVTIDYDDTNIDCIKEEVVIQDTTSHDNFNENCDTVTSDYPQYIDCTDGQQKVDHLNTDVERIWPECDFNSNQDVSEELVTLHHNITEEYLDEIRGLENESKGGSTEYDRSINTEDKPYKCDFSPHKSSKKGNIVKHMGTHTREKPYKCDFCNHTFSQMCHLKRHTRTHTGEKPFKCEVCSYKCTRKELLVIHNRRHTGEKPYKCESCNLRFMIQGHLLAHRLTHTGAKPYKCDFCDYRCARKGNIADHIKTHTGDKPYKCDFCASKFIHKSNLVSHMVKMHGAEKPYKCDFCDYKCSRKGDMFEHKCAQTGQFSKSHSKI